MNSKLFSVLAILGLSLIGGAGCVHKELVSFTDHGSKSLTAMRVQVDKSYVFWASHEFIFYSCAENGDQLTCKRVCGGSNEIVCPMVSENGYGATTNIR